MLRLRPFSPSDIASVQRIVESSMKEEYPPSMFFEIHNHWRDGFIVSDFSGQTVGFVAPIRTEPRSARILVLAVLEPFRGQGIGSALLTAFTNECGLKGMSSVELEVRESNKAAIRFYTKHGYQAIDILPKFYKDGEAGIKMVRTL
jgi:ribosomal-protein-alanine N-acetyltransferase